MKYGFGIDLGGTSIKFGLFDEDANLIYEDSVKTDKSENGAHILDDIIKKIDSILLEKGIKKDNVLGVGIGVPGPVSDDGTVNKCINLGWGVTSVAEYLVMHTGLPVWAENDANIAALGEYTFGSGKGYSSIVFIALGTGIGGGVIIDGKIIKGAHFAGGEIGHIAVMSHEKRVCSCGNINCLETFSSASAIERQANKSCKEVFELAKNGDNVSNEIIDDAIDKLTYVMANVSGVCDPECFVIGGGVVNAGDFLIDRIKKEFPKKAFHASRGTKIVAASLGDKAGIYGAFAMVKSSCDR